MVLFHTSCRKTILSNVVFVSSSNIQYKSYIIISTVHSSQYRYITGRYRVSVSVPELNQVCKEYCNVQSSFDKVLISSFACMLMLIFVVYVCAMLNEPCKKHQGGCSCHVFESDIGMVSASSGAVLEHNGDRQ